MRDQAKKIEDELLVVHKPPLTVSKMGTPPAAETEGLVADVAHLATRLRAASGAVERARLLAAIQNRFGNGFAARVVEAVRQAQPDIPSAPTDGEPRGGGRG